MMEDNNFSELFELIQLLQEEIFKYKDGKSTDKQIIELLGKINALFIPPPKKGLNKINLTKINNLMDIISKLVIIACQVLKH